MHKLLLATTSAFLLLAPLAGAGSYSGSILVGHPLTAVSGGATEIVDACTPDGLAAGADGVWFNIGYASGQAFTVTMDAALDADVWFYTSGCGVIDDNVGAVNGLGADESGVVPAGANYAIVDGFAGTGSFLLTVG